MAYKILIADETDMDRDVLALALGSECEVIEADSGRGTLVAIKENQKELAAILISMQLKDVDTMVLLRQFKDSGIAAQLPIFVLSKGDNAETERKCYGYDVFDFIRKPIDNYVIQKKVQQSIESSQSKLELQDKLKLQKQNNDRLNKLLSEKTQVKQVGGEKLIDAIGMVIEHRNLESTAHVARIKKFTRILAEYVSQKYPEYGLTKERIEVISNASALHDIGKIMIKDSVLLKPGRLTGDEFDYMKSHTLKGCDIIESIKDSLGEEYTTVSKEICRYHHERYDGKGYPEALVGDAIPISAQLVAVAEVYDALISDVIYREAVDKDEAHHMIVNGECGVFSPKLMECFRLAKKELEDAAS